MGKFTDTKYINTIDNLVDAGKSKFNNPYYVFNDKKPTKVNYYAQNIEMSTLDSNSGLYESHIGEGSPFKFNKINEFILYGISQMGIDYDLGDYGIEGNQISGDAYVLPNSIIPRPGDFFSISYIKETLLFKVNGISTDTLDNGANIYKIEYALELTNSIDVIESQIDKKFNYIVSNTGTDYKSIIQESDYNIVTEFESLLEVLITYFENIFFNNRLQTFVYNHNGWNMYDPFIIEFFIRNNILSYGDKYIHVSHATSTDKTFGMDYSKTLFYSLENKDIDLRFQGMVTADLIQDINSLFSTRNEDYYRIRYFDSSPYKTRFEIINTDIIDRIKSNNMYEKDNPNEIYNLWIAYFNNNKDYISGNMIDLLLNSDYHDNKDYFYILAISIFIIERYIEDVLK